jgi:hypothetical protein
MADLSEMLILGGMVTDYAEDQGAFIIPAIVSKGLYAVNDVNPIYNPVDLELGTNGSVNFLIGANTGNYSKPERGLSIMGQYLDKTDVYNFQVHGNNAIALSPNDENATVYIGDAVIYSDADYVYLTSYSKTFSFGDLYELQLTNLHTLRNIKIDGEVYAPEYNIIKYLQNSNQIGYAFRIGSNNHLELIKYLNNNDSSSITQLVATFGSHNTINDSAFSFNTYESAQPINNMPEPSSSSPAISGGYWFTNGNDIFFGTQGGTSERVGINTSNPDADLHVVGKIKTDIFTDGILTINNGMIHDIAQISVDVSHAYGGILFRKITDDGGDYMWNGSARTLFELDEVRLSELTNDMNLNNFYKGDNHTWFDNTQDVILLSQFSNDLMDYDNPSFCNCYIASNLEASNLISSNLEITHHGIVDTLISRIQIVSTHFSSNMTSSNIYNNNMFSDTINSSNIIVQNNISSDSIIGNTFVGSNIDIFTINTSNINSSNLILKNSLHTDKASVNDLDVSLANITDVNISKVISHLTPKSHQTYNLGDISTSWNTTYTKNIVVSETNSIKFGTVGIMVDVLTSEAEESLGDKFLNVTGGGILTNGIVFRDGTQLQSTNDIISAVNEGELFGDFSGFSMIINTNKRSEFFSGTYIYSLNHNIAKYGNEWEIIEFTNQLPPLTSDGSGVNKDLSEKLKSGGNPQDIQLSFIFNNRLVGDHIFLTSTGKSNINDMFPIRNFDPYSKYFQNKCKADFLYYHNFKEIEYNRKSKDLAIFSGDFDTSYVQIASLDLFNSRNTGNKFYDIEIMYYYKSPLFDTKFIIENMTNKYLISKDPETRLTQAYVFDESNGTYSLQIINNEYGLYPRITIQKWNNSVNSTEFTEVIYNTSLGWGLPDNATVFSKFKANGWIKTLFEITYKYIKYGFVIGKFDSDSIITNIDQYVENLTYDDIIFTDENNIISGENIIENNTIFCFKKSVFENLI